MEARRLRVDTPGQPGYHEGDMTVSSDCYPVTPDPSVALRGPTLQEATATWVTFIQRYYADSSSRGELTQVFMKGHFAGWSEREVAMLADGLAERNRLHPPWPDKV